MTNILFRTSLTTPGLASLFLAATVTLTGGSFSGGSAVAQETKTHVAGDTVERPLGDNKSWYYEPAPARQTEYSVATQKAMARGEQRAVRMEVARWHGYSPSRPTHTAGTFTAIHRPSWGWTVGRPFSWYAPRRTVVVYALPHVEYR